MVVRSLFGRRARSTWQRLAYLCLITLAFIFVTSQFKSTQSDARVIPDNGNGGEIDSQESQKKEPLSQEGADPDRVDIPDKPVIIPVKVENLPHEDGIQWNQNRNLKKPKTGGNLFIENEKYPKLSSSRQFIPQRRIVHLDLKGAPFKPEFFVELFAFFNRIKATGVLIEWEDMFPYTGKLASAVNGNAYNMSTVERILEEAKKHHLQVIPLVQTFGHLEWILKLEEFSHLREDTRFPQVICFSDEEGWNVVTDMVDQVASVHKKYGMPFFHMGADEAFQIGYCNASVSRMQKEGSRERLMLWHIARTANYIKEKYEDTTVLAWHDMFANALESDLLEYGLTQVLQPVLWNYAEDLDLYLPRSTWMVLKNFGSVWGSSAWKGADGPARYCTHAQHYLRNHESWISQFTAVYKDFDVVEGLIMTGWSRYDHLAVLAELLPVALPTLAMSMETILEGKPLKGIYPVTGELLDCTPAVELGFFATGCRFPGRMIYELVNDVYQRRRQLRTYREDDYELNGWMSRLADEYSVSSHWYIDKIEPMMEMYAEPLENLEKQLRHEMGKIYYQSTIDEFIFTYMGEDLDWIRRKRATMKRISEAKHFQKRPYVEGTSSRYSVCGGETQTGYGVPKNTNTKTGNKV